MSMTRINDFVLCALLLLGLVGGAKVSYANFTGSACPYIAFVPICYVVTAAYALMLAAIAIRHHGCRHHFFVIGWGVAFVIALTGSVLEVVAGGGVCPTTGGSLRGGSAGSVPLCFASLALLIVILVLFLAGPYRRACDRFNSSPRLTS